MKLAAPNPSGHPAETVPRLFISWSSFPPASPGCMSRPREPSGGAQKPGKRSGGHNHFQTWGQSPLPPLCLTPCLGTVKGAWPLSSSSYVGLGSHLWPTQYGRNSPLWASERWPGRKRAKSGTCQAQGVEWRGTGRCRGSCCGVHFGVWSVYEKHRTDLTSFRWSLK